METEKDYFKLLKFADNHLKSIKRNEEYLLKHPEYQLEISQSVRYFALDIESALDYLVYDLFQRYSKSLIKSEDIEEIEQKLSFPNLSRNRKDQLPRLFKKAYPEIDTKYPKIVALITEVQPFNYPKDQDSWLFTINEIANKAKHRYLTETSYRTDGKIQHLNLGNNIIIKNGTFTNNRSTISVNGESTSDADLLRIDPGYKGKNKVSAKLIGYDFIARDFLSDVLTQSTELITKLDTEMSSIE